MATTWAPEVLDLFLELAAIPSPSGQERAVADRVERKALIGKIHVYAIAGAGAVSAFYVVFRVVGLIRTLEAAMATGGAR